MELIRNIIVAYGKRVNEIEPFECSMEIGEYSCSIESLCIWDNEPPIEVLLSGGIHLNEYPDVEDGVIQIPEEPKKVLESKLEYLANLITMVNSAKRRLFSPIPTVAFTSESEEDNQYLTDKIFPNQFDGKSKMITNPDLEMGQDLIAKLSDRVDGVMLIAEALSCRHATGAFHEYMRVFERAFRVANKDLIGPLQQFLHKSKYKVKPNEAENWISKYRHPSIHADERDYFHIESDIRPIIGRVKQVAFDVLLNKRNWRSDDIERRGFWNPGGFINDPEGDSLTIEFEADTTKSASFDPPTTFDIFDAYPLHDSGHITDPPEQWMY